MRILYIVGNGFDLNLGLKTDYHSFYKYYLDQPTSNSTIQKLKEKISQEQYTNWSDLELGLGRYASECTKDEYLLILDDIRTHLNTYLKKEAESKRFGPSKSFLEDLKNPVRHLDRIVLEDYNLYCATYMGVSESDDIDIITFNYTYTFENVLERRARIGDSIVNVQRNFDDTTVRQLVHVHGTLDNELNLGVNDITQILNNSFSDDMDVIENAVKPEFNDACLNGNNSACEDLIKKANLIVLFGVSIGETDYKWWSLIGKKLKTHHCVVLFYPFDEKKDDIKHPNSKRRWTNNYVTFLKDRMGIPENNNSSLSGLILVGINKPIFREVIVQNLKEEGGKEDHD